MKTTLVPIKPLAPFKFDATVYVPHYFPTPDSVWQPGTIWQTLNLDGEIYGLKMENRGDVLEPQIDLTLYSETKCAKENVDRVVEELTWRYGFDEDISVFYDEFTEDEFLNPVFKRWTGMKANCANSLYELLMISIVLQNATVRRTVQMMDNLFKAYGKKIEFDGKELYAYWGPETLGHVDEQELRALKVGYRAKTIKRVSEMFTKHEIDEHKLRQMGTREAEKELIRLPGVGPATAQILLNGYLRRYDSFDLKGRLWEQKILSRVMFGEELVPAEKIVNAFNKRYGCWRGLAFHYIFTDLFWRHKEEKIDWLEKEIRL